MYAQNILPKQNNFQLYQIKQCHGMLRNPALEKQVERPLRASDTNSSRSVERHSSFHLYFCLIGIQSRLHFEVDHFLSRFVDPF